MKCKATFKDVSHLASEQEETKTKQILHTNDARRSGGTPIHIHFPDTDVFILVISPFLNYVRTPVSSLAQGSKGELFIEA